MNDSVIFKSDALFIYGKKFVPYIRNDVIKKRIREISKTIKKDFNGKIPVLIIVLKGAIFFASELMKNLNIPLFVETLRARSYGNQMQSSGKIELFMTCEELTGRDLIVVEDIIDTGLTISTVLDELKRFKPNSISIATLLLKPMNLKHDLEIKYFGFEIPDKFVIGFGLDYAEFGRNLKDIYILA